MRYSTPVAAALLSTSALAAPHSRRQSGLIKCPITFDGRVPTGTTPTFFDSSNALFNPDYVHGNNLKWSQILKLPGGDSSRFDGTDHIPVEVTISDQSVFQEQHGFRRAGLQFIQDSSSGPGQTGVKTLHWSVKQDSARPLNLTHEYLNVWHEAADYSADQLQFQTGTLIGKSASDKNNFKILDRTGKSLYSVAMDPKQWQNFAATLDYTKNTIQIYYSAGNATLKSVTSAVAADISGGGQFQIGILKKPTGTSDVVNSGYQESSLNEGQIYGGLFLEDSTGGCVSL